MEERLRIKYINILILSIVYRYHPTMYVIYNVMFILWYNKSFPNEYDDKYKI